MPQFQIALTSTDTKLCSDQVKNLAKHLKLPIVEADRRDFSYLLNLTTTHLELRQVHTNAKPIYIDFLTGATQHRRLYGGGKQQLIARAVGIKSHYKPSVIDATAGLGNDAFVLACLGCNILMLERSPFIAALLNDALTRAKTHEIFQQLKFELQIGNAIEYLQKLAGTQQPDVIYLDPMFPERTKSALVKKEMRILRDLVGDDADTSALIEIALQRANKRVVVKRPRLANTSNHLKPDLIYAGKSSRFDVYLT